VTRQMRAVKKSDYQRCFHQWQEHWNKCIQAEGHYFEGDKTQLAIKSTLSLTKKSVPELNDQSSYKAVFCHNPEDYSLKFNL
jgi:hypothetical protein